MILMIMMVDVRKPHVEGWHAGYCERRFAFPAHVVKVQESWKQTYSRMDNAYSICFRFGVLCLCFMYFFPWKLFGAKSSILYSMFSGNLIINIIIQTQTDFDSIDISI